MNAVLFDVGGPIDTELQLEAFVDLHIQHALAAEGLAVTEMELMAASAWAVEVHAPRTYAAMLWRLSRGDRAIASRALEAVNARSDERNRLRGGIEARDGIADLIRELDGRGVRIGLAANQPEGVLAQLDRLGIGQCLRPSEMTGTHGIRKPDPRLFLRACELLDVEPRGRVMVGDRIDNDIAPAAALGMRTVLIRTGRHRDQQPRSASELPDVEVIGAQGIATAFGGMLS